MANITKLNDPKCYSCGKQCINVEFCGEGGSYDTGEDGGINLSRNLKVKIVANPEFWGFSGVLISGWATFNNGYYDFFDGYAEDHLEYKTCGVTVSGPFFNENRPDVLYRSVYDPSSGVKNYGADGVLDGVNRGGAEVYLIDRPKGLIDSVTSDSPSCDNVEPTQIFKKTPENFGWGNKISSKNKVFKNITGAWRLTSLENCYDDSLLYKPSGFRVQCDGTEKQNIIYRDHQFENFDKTIPRASGSGNCLPDGASAGRYSGTFGPSGIYRNTGESIFLQAHLSYDGGAASGIRNGLTVGIQNSINTSYDGLYTVFDVVHSGLFSKVKFVGQTGTSNVSIDIGESGNWSALGSYDKNTCCGESAYGVDDSTKSIDTNNYHTDFRRIFNNPKNIRQSNRNPGDRETYGMDVINPISTGLWKDYTYPEISSSGTVVLESGHPVFHRELPYYGTFFKTDLVDSGIRNDQNVNRMIGRNATCYSKAATLEIFPDCVTQYSRYNQCTTNGEKFQQNRVPRLAFVYRGCNFDDSCSFDSSGRPLAGWSGGAPTGINDLKRNLGGQEIHMFINLGDAWGGVTQTCPCDCGENPDPGSFPPDHVIVPSPVSYPALPNFDLYPDDYGCQDAYHQLSKYRQYVTPDGSPPSPRDQCDPIHTLPECCNVRQPYTTYGYMMNLCGKQTQDRKRVIAEAFAKYTQDKTYLHNSTGVDINEPMYWGIECPAPEPFATGSPPFWSTGVTGNDKFSNISGENYGYWGLSDSNGIIVAPYFRTKAGYTDCCDVSIVPKFVDFDGSGTFYNGWPTTSVPFLIEIEVDDVCAGCATSNMPSDALSLQIDSLDAKYIHGFGLASNDAYGFNHCRYSEDYVVSIGPPSFDCTTGFAEDYCVSGDALQQDFGTRHTGGTCDCITGTTISLAPVLITGTNIVKGFISNSITNSIVEIPTCNKPKSTYLDSYYPEELASSSEGFTVFGRFTLTCAGMQSYLQDPIYPDASYVATTDFLSLLWANSINCAIHKPARIGEDLVITSRLWAVRTEFKDLFERIPEDIIDRGYFDIETPLSISSFSGINNIFGLCPGDKLYTYGCMVSGNFYGCHNPCPSGDACSTCPTGVGSGEVICTDCGTQVGYDGVSPRFLPYRKRLNSCGCLCEDPTLIAEYEINPDWSWTLVAGDPSGAACANIYWMGASGNRGLYLDATLLNPEERMGVDLGTYEANDWADFSHGVNSSTSGITHRLNPPIMESDCGSLSVSSCDTNSSCTSDTRAGSATCGTPIYGVGDSSVSVNRMKCHPEIAIVSKIECLPGSGYKLFVSREYHEHDRTWYEQIVTSADEQLCVAKYAGSYQYAGSCTTIKYANPTDSVTPAYNAPCSVNPPSGANVTQDFTFNTKPVSSGDTLWNYYNLFYQGTFPTSQLGIIGSFTPSVNRDGDGIFECASTGSYTGMAPIFGTGNFFTPSGYFGTLSINAKHSCLQDIQECGGDLWCNKLFFPRHHYASGTSVSYFGAPSLCLSNNQFKTPALEGYEDFTNIMFQEQKLKYIDWCNENSKVSIIGSMGIDDTEMIVSDYLPLMGVSHPGWRYTQDVKSCTVVGTGCNGYALPTHSDYTIAIGAHTPRTFENHKFESMGYYLDKYNASGTDNCLFNPFKVMIDVECSTNNIRRKGIVGDDPLLLTAYSRFPSAACRGLDSDAPCGCADTQCKHFGTEGGGTCTRLAVAGFSGVLESVDYLCSGAQSVCVDCVYGPHQVIRQYSAVLLLDEDLLSPPPSPLIGTYNSCQDCSIFVPPSGSVIQNRCFGSQGDMSQWMLGCDGVYYKIVDYKYTHKWECDSNKFINPATYATVYNDECDCEADWTKGLCGSEKMSSLSDSCDLIIDRWADVPEEYPYTGGHNQWWKECGCIEKPTEEAPCSTDSIVKMTITEGI